MILLGNKKNSAGVGVAKPGLCSARLRAGRVWPVAAILGEQLRERQRQLG